MGKESSEMKLIVRDHRVFWTTLPIELPGDEGRPVKVGISLALVGTDADNGVTEDASGEPTVYNKLYKLAKWLSSRDEPDVRFEIRRHDNVVFYLPDHQETKRKDYVVIIRILHSGQFDLPLDKSQLHTMSEFEKKLKEIGSPKERWKERSAII
jgi:hypothetical protein